MDHSVGFLAHQPLHDGAAVVVAARVVAGARVVVGAGVVVAMVVVATVKADGCKKSIRMLMCASM